MRPYMTFLMQLVKLLLVSIETIFVGSYYPALEIIVTEINFNSVYFK